MKSRLTIPAVVLAALIAASTALAAKPTKGATYSGKINRRSSGVFKISFKVSKNGRRVGGFSVEYPVYCEGGGFGKALTRSATITKKGTFTAKLPIYFAPTHMTQGYVIVTGKFQKGGKESGKVTTKFTSPAACNGTSSYTTTAG